MSLADELLADLEDEDDIVEEKMEEDEAGLGENTELVVSLGGNYCETEWIMAGD